MGKFVFWVGVIALIWMAVRLVKVLQRKAELRSSEDKDARDPQNQGKAAKPAGDSPVPMMQCAHCGVYLPGHDAVHQGSRAFCSIEHRDAGPARAADDSR